MASSYAIEGSAAHELARMALAEGKDAAAYVGRIVRVEQTEHARLSASGAHRWMNCPGSLSLEGEAIGEESTATEEVEITDDFVEPVQLYLDHVRRHADGSPLFIEQRLDFGAAIGVPGMFGTADAVIVKGGTLIVIDLKYGRGVKVDARDNEQLMLYGLGALEQFGLLDEFNAIDLHIVQPRIEHIDQHIVSVEEMGEFAQRARVAAGATAAPPEQLVLNPGEKQCRFCKAKATCPALRNEVAQTLHPGPAPLTPAEFARLLPDAPASDIEAEWLAVCMTKIGMVEDWCKAVRAEVERRLLAGEPIAGYKLVEGRRGARQWTDEGAVWELFKGFRLKQDEMYEFSLISPTKAEKLLKESPKRWAKVEPLITQPQGKVSVAPESDKRPAVSRASVVDAFPKLA